MILHLTDGQALQKAVGSPTMGLNIKSLTLSGQDMYQLLQMNNGELREHLRVLYTRFAPFPEERSDD